MMSLTAFADVNDPALQQRLKNAGAKADLELKKPVTTQWLVVWLTGLPTAPDGFQGRVAEIAVSS